MPLPIVASFARLDSLSDDEDVDSSKLPHCHRRSRPRSSSTSSFASVGSHSHGLTEYEPLSPTRSALGSDGEDSDDEEEADAIVDDSEDEDGDGDVIDCPSQPTKSQRQRVAECQQRPLVTDAADSDPPRADPAARPGVAAGTSTSALMLPGAPVSNRSLTPVPPCTTTPAPARSHSAFPRSSSAAAITLSTTAASRQSNDYNHHHHRQPSPSIACGPTSHTLAVPLSHAHHRHLTQIQSHLQTVLVPFYLTSRPRIIPSPHHPFYQIAHPPQAMPPMIHAAVRIETQPFHQYSDTVSESSPALESEKEMAEFPLTMIPRPGSVHAASLQQQSLRWRPSLLDFSHTDTDSNSEAIDYETQREFLRTPLAKLLGLSESSFVSHVPRAVSRQHSQHNIHANHHHHHHHTAKQPHSVASIMKPMAMHAPSPLLASVPVTCGSTAQSTKAGVVSYAKAVGRQSAPISPALTSATITNTTTDSGKRTKLPPRSKPPTGSASQRTVTNNSRRRWSSSASSAQSNEDTPKSSTGESLTVDDEFDTSQIVPGMSLFELPVSGDTSSSWLQSQSTGSEAAGGFAALANSESVESSPEPPPALPAAAPQSQPQPQSRAKNRRSKKKESQSSPSTSSSPSPVPVLAPSQGLSNTPSLTPLSVQPTSPLLLSPSIIPTNAVIQSLAQFSLIVYALTLYRDVATTIQSHCNNVQLCARQLASLCFTRVSRSRTQHVKQIKSQLRKHHRALPSPSLATVIEEPPSGTLHWLSLPAARKALMVTIVLVLFAGIVGLVFAAAKVWYGPLSNVWNRTNIPLLV